MTDDFKLRHTFKINLIVILINLQLKYNNLFMNIIELESRDNWKIKNLSKLKLKKYRQKEGKFVVENWKIIQDASKDKIYFSEIFVTKNFLEKNKEKLEEIFQNIQSDFIFLISEKIVSQISSLKNPEGVLAVYYIKEVKLDFEKDIIYLDSISDPGNMGTVLRSALAFGMENIILNEGCVDIYNPKVIQSSKDAIFKLNISFDSEKNILAKIKERGIKVFATDVKDGGEMETVFKKEKNVCLILGNESRGVSPEFLAMADEFINIKTTNKIESLNVAVSAGIIFYEIFKAKREYNKAL